MPNPTIPLGTNLCILAGPLVRTPELRTLPSGTVVASFEVRPPGPAASGGAVPVAWPDPPAGVASWCVGDALVVVGRVQRRFFRAGGATQSRTEVLASAVVPARRRAQVARLREEVLGLLAAA